jgi:hypothetical protein
VAARRAKRNRGTSNHAAATSHVATTARNEASNAAPSANEAPKIVASTDRLDKETMTTVLEIVLNNMVKRHMVGSMEIDGACAMITDVNTVLAAHELWRQILQRTIISRIHDEVAKRKLLPVTIHTLCSLLFDALKQFE